MFFYRYRAILFVTRPNQFLNQSYLLTYEQVFFLSKQRSIHLAAKVLHYKRKGLHISHVKQIK